MDPTATTEVQAPYRLTTAQGVPHVVTPIWNSLTGHVNVYSSVLLGDCYHLSGTQTAQLVNPIQDDGVILSHLHTFASDTSAQERLISATVRTFTESLARQGVYALNILSWSLHSDQDLQNLQDMRLRRSTVLHTVGREYYVITWNGLGAKPTVYVRDETVRSRLSDDEGYRRRLICYISGMVAHHFLPYDVKDSKRQVNTRIIENGFETKLIANLPATLKKMYEGMCDTLLEDTATEDEM